MRTMNGVHEEGAAERSNRRQLTLKYIFRGDFRKSEATLQEEALKESGLEKLRGDDCIILLSGNGRIVKFVFGFIEGKMVNALNKETGRTSRILPSRTYRIVDHGSWNPYMLQNYANELGLELRHLKRLEAHLRVEQENAEGAK